MKSLLAYIGIPIAGIAVIIGLLWGGIQVYAWLMPQQKAAERKVFEETPSFVHGKIQYLSRLRVQYESADGNQRESLKRLILMEASMVPPEKLPQELQSFLRGLQR